MTRSRTHLRAGIEEKDETLWVGVNNEYVCRRAGQREGRGNGCGVTRRTTLWGPGNEEDGVLGVGDDEDEATLAPILVALLGS